MADLDIIPLIVFPTVGAIMPLCICACVVSCYCQNRRARKLARQRRENLEAGGTGLPPPTVYVPGTYPQGNYGTQPMGNTDGSPRGAGVTPTSQPSSPTYSSPTYSSPTLQQIFPKYIISNVAVLNPQPSPFQGSSVNGFMAR